MGETLKFGCRPDAIDRLSPYRQGWDGPRPDSGIPTVSADGALGQNPLRRLSMRNFSFLSGAAVGNGLKPIW